MTRPLIAAALAACAAAAPAMADITFQTSDDILIVRITDQFGIVSVEVIAPAGMGVLSCVLVDAGGQPLAIAQGFTNIGTGTAMAQDVDPDQVAAAHCNVSPI